jgi:hypothetical protein
MKKLALLFFVGVLISALVGSSTVWAGGTFTPVSGTLNLAVVEDEDTRQWVDEDGISHVRGGIMEWVSGGGAFVGTGRGIYNLNINWGTGDGDVQAFHYFDFSFGEVSGTFAGHAADIITGFTLAGEFVAHGDGGFAGMHLRWDGTMVLGSGFTEYDGILHDPHGGGGDKAIPADSQTWGSVKALYR